MIDMPAKTELRLFNSLTRSLETFEPVHPGEARVYSCGPTVYNYQHIGNMRAYIFADILGRTLRWKGYDLRHVVNITDVGHLTSDADEGEDKLEKMAATKGKSAREIADYYQQDFEADLRRLNIRKPQHPKATDYVHEMIAWGETIANKHCYELDGGLYFDVTTVTNYGRLARAPSDDDGESRIAPVAGKRNAADFAIWRKTPSGETRQMEWDSPWGRGAPGWHLECSVMGEKLLGFPFDIHTGGIDHREIHHPNEIAQNQAFCGGDASGARIWMHNNFLVDRTGKMSKSSGEFLRLQLLIDKGYHPIAYRLMCLQAHYRSELEFSWEGLAAALTRLKRMVMQAEALSDAENGDPNHRKFETAKAKFREAMNDDLNTPIALTALEEALAVKKVDAGCKRSVVEAMNAVLGLNLLAVNRKQLRIAPKHAEITEAEITDAIARRKTARVEKDFTKSDAIRDELTANGVEIMDGDPLEWDWKLSA
ncbi:MAG: cysteine--tRNA ligase [Pontixanthobacter sp.]